MKLTRKQINIFQTDGFLVIRNLLPMNQVDEINVGYQKAISAKLMLMIGKSGLTVYQLLN